MAKIRFNKNTLNKERQQLRLYERLLPSLDLKRRQLTVEAERARQLHREAEAEKRQLEDRAAEQLRMLGNPRLSVGGLVRVTGIVLGEENLLGVRMPVLERIDFAIAPYSLLAKPAWVDLLVRRLQEAIEARVREQVLARRLSIVDLAKRRTTQRVNLFERILIPTAKRTIQRIQIYLGDFERDAVVRSKIAKAKQLQRSASAVSTESSS